MKPENITCPECDGPMVSRKNRTDGSIFWGCKKFPECRGTRDSEGRSFAERQEDSYGFEPAFPAELFAADYRFRKQ